MGASVTLGGLASLIVTKIKIHKRWLYVLCIDKLNRISSFRTIAFAVHTFKKQIDHVILCLCYVLANIKVIYNILKLFQNYCIFNYIRYIFSIYNKTKYLSE